MKSVCYLTLKRENLSQKFDKKTNKTHAITLLTKNRHAINRSPAKFQTTRVVSHNMFQIWGVEGELSLPPSLLHTQRFDLKIELTFWWKFLENCEFFELRQNELFFDFAGEISLLVIVHILFSRFLLIFQIYQQNCILCYFGVLY